MLAKVQLDNYRTTDLPAAWLTQLGSSYGKFDREGKIMYIEQMETMMDRYKVFMKRFELSEDFSAR